MSFAHGEKRCGVHRARACDWPAGAPVIDGRERKINNDSGLKSSKKHECTILPSKSSSCAERLNPAFCNNIFSLQICSS